jgi:hypothetical protein
MEGRVCTCQTNGLVGKEAVEPSKNPYVKSCAGALSGSGQYDLNMHEIGVLVPHWIPLSENLA